MAISHAARLQEWLRRHDIDVGPDSPALLRGPVARRARRRALRQLNGIESRFDDVLRADPQTRFLDWDVLREELDLLPPAHSPWLLLLETLRERLGSVGYHPLHVARAARLWRDFIVAEEEQLNSLQVPDGWIAGLDYLLQALYFVGDETQEGIGQRHNVSTSTVGLRFRALVEALNIHLFDHPARKQLMARRAIAIEGGQMSEEEFNRRLLQGDRVGLTG